MISIFKRKGNRFFAWGKWHNIGNLDCRYTKGTNCFGEQSITIFWSEAL